MVPKPLAKATKGIISHKQCNLTHHASQTQHHHGNLQCLNQANPVSCASRILVHIQSATGPTAGLMPSIAPTAIGASFY